MFAFVVFVPHFENQPCKYEFVMFVLFYCIYDTRTLSNPFVRFSKYPGFDLAIFQLSLSSPPKLCRI